MRFSAITATLLCALGVFAAPNALPELTELSGNDAIVARAALMDNTPIGERGIHKRDWKCANRKYSMIAIGAAIAKALVCIASGEQHGNGCYPHVFQDHGKSMFPDHDDELWEFPIKDGGSIFGSSKNQKPGLDRVVFKKGGGLVGLITHAGSGSGQFAHCLDGA